MALRKIDLMHRQFGKTEGHTCRECNNLVKEEYHGRTYTKCKVYGQTMSAASDWVQRYQACGMFNKPWNDRPIIRLVRPDRKEREKQENTPIEGQLSMDDLDKRRYFVKSRFSGWREVTEKQFARWCDHIRKNAVAMKPEERERHIQENTRIEE